MALPVTITGISTAVAPVGPFKVAAGTYQGDAAINLLSGTISTTPTVYGPGSTREAVAQNFTNPSASSLTIGSCAFRLYGQFSPTDDVYAQVCQTNHAGTVLATSTSIPINPLWDYTSSNIIFTFPTPAVIAGSATFAVVLRRTATDASNLFGVVLRSEAYAGGASKILDGTTGIWGADANDCICAVYSPNLVIATDAYYFFGRDGTTATTLQAFKSTAPDTSWASVTTRTGFTTAILGLSAYQVGPIIHIAVMDGTLASSIAHKYVSFNASTDTFLATTETIMAAANPAGQIAGVGAGNSIVVRGNGEAVVFYNSAQTNTSGTPRARVSYARRTGVSTWASAVRVDSNTAVDNSTPVAVLGASDRVHFFWTAATSTGLRTLSAANALNTGTTNANMTPGDGCSYDRAGTIKVVVTSNVNGSQGTLRLNSADNPTVTFANQSIATATIPHRIGAFPNTDDVTVVYRSSADSDLYAIKSTDDGATFGTAASFFVGTVASADANVSRNASGGVYTRGSSTVVGYIVNDGGTLKYNENALSTATYTLIADAGHVIVYDTDTELQRNRGLTAATGSVALAGLNAGLRKGYPPALVGAVNVSGVATALRTTRATVATTYPVTLSGAATALRNNNILIASAGAVAVTRYDANLIPRHVYTLPIAKGSVAVAFNDAALGALSVYDLDATVGAVTVSLKDAALRHAGIMPAAVGARALAGQAVTLRYGHMLIAAAGPVVLSGKVATLRHATVMPAVRGAVALNGIAAQLDYSRKIKMVAAKGAVALAASPAGLTPSSAPDVLLATVGAVTASMQAANLRATYVLKALPSSQIGDFVDDNGVSNFIDDNSATSWVDDNGLTLGGFSGPVTVVSQDVTLHRTAASMMPAVKGTVYLNGVGGKYAWNAGRWDQATWNYYSLDVVLRVGRRLITQAGAVTLTGSLANLSLRRIYAMIAAPGGIVLTGIPAALNTANSKTMIAAKGDIVLSGKAAAFRIERKMPATGGPIIVTGVAASLDTEFLVHYTLDAATKAIELHGVLADLQHGNRQYPIDPGPGPTEENRLNPGVLRFGRPLILLPDHR